MKSKQRSKRAAITTGLIAMSIAGGFAFAAQPSADAQNYYYDSEYSNCQSWGCTTYQSVVGDGLYTTTSAPSLWETGRGSVTTHSNVWYW